MRIVARVAFLLVIFGAGYGTHMLQAWYHSIQCLPEPTGAEVLVADTHWIARIRGIFCGYGVSGMTDIQIVRTDGADPIIIAEGPDVDQASLDGSAPHKLLIALPKRAQVGAIDVRVPDLEIVWKWEE